MVGRDKGNIFLFFSAPEQLMLNGRVQVTQQPNQNALPHQLLVHGKSARSCCFWVFFPPDEKNHIFSTFYFNKFASNNRTTVISRHKFYKSTLEVDFQIIFVKNCCLLMFIGKIFSYYLLNLP